MATAVSFQDIDIDGLCQPRRAINIAAIAISSDGPRLVPSALFHGANENRPLSGRFSRSRPCRPSDATALTRPMRNAPMITRAPLGPHPIQDAKNTPPTPANSPR